MFWVCLLLLLHDSTYTNFCTFLTHFFSKPCRIYHGCLCLFASHHHVPLSRHCHTWLESQYCSTLPVFVPVLSLLQPAPVQAPPTRPLKWAGLLLLPDATAFITSTSIDFSIWVCSNLTYQVPLWFTKHFLLPCFFHWWVSHHCLSLLLAQQASALALTLRGWVGLMLPCHYYQH